jgi:transcriptional regulator with XRE-family HTH domain
MTETPGLLLREARERHEVTQAELARRAGTTQSAISRIEKDRVSPTIDTLRDLLSLVGEELSLETSKAKAGGRRLPPEADLVTDFIRRHRGMAARVAAYADELKRLEDRLSR